ncbi:MAG: hypothetical protein QOJ53_2359 [Sphingomonadales bacterium]|jgi:hypothetical protein|nr:hypothetical protein [Sphingomonadales bacterium]MEA3045577.1 hypothetical protein [Sphingomonadales bacterium]MEA3048027.1 hypothetical protein [Sphingomonadales bacterium]
MLSFRSLAVASSALLAAAAVPSSAQNTNADPNYGTVTLRTGFTPDPRVVSLRAGGDIDASNAGSGCSGFITNAPDVRLVYSGGSLPLIISVAASSDTTLVVNGPDGRFYCDDDGGVGGLNPSVRFSNPQSGRYEIWVGTYRSGATQAARLHLSELGSQ